MGYLSWVKTMLRSPASRRAQWKQELIDGLKAYRSPKKNPSSDVKYLSEILEKEKDVEFVGFTPDIEYIKEKMDPEIAGDEQSQLECIWKHDHMNPALLYWVPELHIFIIVGPGLRFNDSVLNEVGMSKQKTKGVNG